MKQLTFLVDLDSFTDLRELLRVVSIEGALDKHAVEEIIKRRRIFSELFSQMRDRSYLELE